MGWTPLAADQGAPQLPSETSGIVVEDVGVASAFVEAGLRPGDLVVAWKRLPAPPANPQGAQGVLESVFDWNWLEVEQAPRGALGLSIRRGGTATSLEVGPGRWETAVRPRMPTVMLDHYSKGRKLIESGDLEAGIDLWRTSIRLAEDQTVDAGLGAWLLFRIGNIWAEATQWQKAQQAYHSALETAQYPLAKSAIWQALGDAYAGSNNLDEARKAYRFAQELQESTWGESLTLAKSLTDLGRLDLAQSRFDSAEGYWQRVLEIRQKLAPGSLDMASSLNDLGNLAADRGDPEKAAEYYEKALEIRRKVAPDSLDVASSLNNLGTLASERDDLDQAADYYKSALEIRQRLAPYTLDLAASLNNLGNLAHQRGDLNKATEYHEKCLQITEELAPGSLRVATSLDNLSRLAADRGDLDRADEYSVRALKIRQEVAPDSLAMEMSLNSLGRLSYMRGDLEEATQYFERSLEIAQRLAPGSLRVASNLNSLGSLEIQKGDLLQAAEYFEEALDIARQLAPSSLYVAAGLNNLGVLTHRQGDLDRAAEYYEKALNIRRTLAPESLDVAVSLNNLGNLSRERGDSERASKYHQEALRIRQRMAPGSLDVATSLTNLGILARLQNDLDRAAEYHEQALKIQKHLAPDSLYIAASLSNLGMLARDRGDLDRAAGYQEEALKIRERLAPNSRAVALSLNTLGAVTSERGDLRQATEYHERALEILNKLAPGSAAAAESLYALATLRRKQKRPQAALTLLYRALEALENQIERLGGSRDIQADFRAEYSVYYRDTIDLSIELHELENAFHILERSRARSFLAQITERDLMFSDTPESLQRKRWQIVHRYDKTQNKISQLNSNEQEREIEGLLAELRQLHRDYEDVMEKIVKSSPRLESLRAPQPLHLDAARQILDPGTVMLSYSISKDETHLFILQRDEELQVKTLPLGEGELRGEVEKILELQKRGAVPMLYTNPLRQAARYLYQALIQPAEEAIAKSDRILIVPDGCLHLLPFGLLIRKPEPKEGLGDRDFEYLVEWKPLHAVLSATVYEELKSQRRSDPTEDVGALVLAAFGDPLYPPGKSGDEIAADRSVDVYVRSAAERGFEFDPLPYSREEVNRIASLYPDGVVHAFLGAEATEKQAKVIGKNGRILHFATHGRYDNRFPMNSYLALTIPERFQEGQENGLLQVWEIYESVRLDADLVVLSACESGVGEEVNGEGLKGLTRAFQFAGARTVVSSLWQVDDRATAELMERFYRHLAAGMAKDEAMRAAQVELIRGPLRIKNPEGQIEERDLSAPYYWAAFQVIGDWR